MSYECGFITSTGEPCSRHVQRKGQRCWQHKGKRVSGSFRGGPYSTFKQRMVRKIDPKDVTVIENQSVLSTEHILHRLSILPFSSHTGRKVPFIIHVYADDTEGKKAVTTEDIVSKVKPLDGFIVTVLRPGGSLYIKGSSSVVPDS